MEPNEITLVGWVDEALEQSLTKKNKNQVQIQGYNPKVMDSKIQPLKIYITTSIHDQKNENDYINEETSQNQIWRRNLLL